MGAPLTSRVDNHQSSSGAFVSSCRVRLFTQARATLVMAWVRARPFFIADALVGRVAMPVGLWPHIRFALT